MFSHTGIGNLFMPALERLRSANGLLRALRCPFGRKLEIGEKKTLILTSWSLEKLNVGCRCNSALGVGSDKRKIDGENSYICVTSGMFDQAICMATHTSTTSAVVTKDVNTEYRCKATIEGSVCEVNIER